MSKRIWLVLLAPIALGVVAVIVGAAEGPSKTDPTLPSRLKLAREALKAMEALQRASEKVDHEATHLWSVRLMECERDLSATQAGRVQAAQAHVGRMKQFQVQAQQRARAGEAGILESLDASYDYEEAVSNLEREKAR